MSKGKKLRTPADRANQKARTTANQIKKYINLTEKFPSDPHISIWKDNLSKLTQQ